MLLTMLKVAAFDTRFEKEWARDWFEVINDRE